jgi:hypothetical protein
MAFWARPYQDRHVVEERNQRVEEVHVLPGLGVQHHASHRQELLEAARCADAVRVDEVLELAVVAQQHAVLVPRVVVDARRLWVVHRVLVSGQPKVEFLPRVRAAELREVTARAAVFRIERIAGRFASPRGLRRRGDGAVVAPAPERDRLSDSM